MVRSIQKIHQESPSSDRMTDNALQVIEPILRKEILDGRLIKNISFLADPVVTSIEHGLGRNYIGFFATNVHSGFGVFSKGNNNNSDKFINLISLVDCEVDMWVF